MSRTVAVCVLVAALAAGARSVLAHPAPPGRAAAGHSRAIPPFSRQYRTSCSTCHVAPGKLNAQGEAFRLNGYRFPAGLERAREDDPVPLGAEPWKELWPEAIWPGEIPGSMPLSVYIGNELRVGRRTGGRVGATYTFPAVVGLEAASTVGGGIAAFAEVIWTQAGGVQVGEAKIKLQDPLPWLPDRSLNVWLGALSPQLLTFADPGLDRAARHFFQWQRLRLADWQVEDAGTGQVLVSESTFRLAGVYPAVELNGLAGGRLFYALGLTQPGPAPSADAGHDTDVYLKLRYKLGGLGLDGRVPARGEAVAWGGQLLDQGLTVESFAYLGSTPVDAGVTDQHRSYGLAAHAVHGRADAGIGYVWGRHSDPWAVTGAGARLSSVFARAEYLFFPWLLGTVKYDRARLRVSGAALTARFPELDRTRLLPGAVMLIRHNVRVVAEGELFLRDRPATRTDGESASALWLRLDLMF